MDMEEKLARAYSKQHASDQTLTDGQIVTRLKGVFAHLQEEHTFVPGQVLLHKYPSLAMTKASGKPCVFVRYLEMTIDISRAVKPTEMSEYFNSNAARVLDCAIMVLHDDSAVTYLLDSTEYRPHPDFSEAT
jgi:hypothetical protein